MDKLSLDYETASKADLKKCGADVYSRHPSTRVLMLGYRFNREQTRLWLPHKGPMPRLLREGIESKDVIKTAFNAPFELSITENTLGLQTPIDRWRCVQVMAFSLGLPGKLEPLVRDALKLPKQFHKDPEGDRLLRKFAFPSSRATHLTDPDDFEKLGRYCVQDVNAECKAYDVMLPYIENIDELFRRWVIDQRINRRGLPIDYEFIDAALDLAEESKAEYVQELKDRTGLQNPNSTKQLLPWLQERGYPYASLAKNKVEIAVRESTSLTEEAKEVIQLRLESNKTSITKFARLRDASYGGRLRNTYQYRGAAATGRWAGRILGQNIPRPWKGVEDHLAEARRMILQRDMDSIKWFFGKPLEVIVSSIRSAIAPPPGKKFAVADLSSIELVVIAWLTNCTFWLDVIAQGKDAYKAFAERWLQIPYESVSKAQRTLSKPAALGCGYRMGAGRQVKDPKTGDLVKTGLWGYAANMGVAMTKKQCKEAVKVYRELSVEIVEAWTHLEEAAMHCVKTGEKVRSVGGIVFDRKRPFLRMRLPSGRCIHYCRPLIEMVEIEYEKEDPVTGEIEVVKSKKLGVTYERVSQTSGKWVRRGNHGGRYIEQAVQGIAADVLEGGLHEAEADGGIPVVGHYHDEIISEADINDVTALKRLIACMVKRKDWASTMMVRAEGFEDSFYHK